MESTPAYLREQLLTYSTFKPGSGVSDQIMRRQIDSLWRMWRTSTIFATFNLMKAAGMSYEEAMKVIRDAFAISQATAHRAIADLAQVVDVFIRSGLSDIGHEETRDIILSALIQAHETGAD